MLRLQTIARLGQDAVVNNVNNKTVVNFTAAYSEKYKNSEGVEVSNTVWISCSYWSERINIANYLKKGTQIYLEGRPDVKIYTNRQNVSMPQLTLRVTNIQLLSSNQSPKTAEKQTPIDNYINNDNGEVVDGLPF